MDEKQGLNERGKLRAHVLLVDDNQAMLKLMRAVLEGEGLSVEVASSVGEARDLLMKGGERFDIVVSDINMPLETGFDLLQWIKSDASGIASMPVLLTTAELPEAHHRLKGLSLGAVDYVVRPVDLGEFAIRVLHAVENHQRIRSLEVALQNSQGLALVGRLLAASNHEIKNLASIVTITADQVSRLINARVPTLSPLENASLAALNESAGLLLDVARHITDLLEPGVKTDSVPIDLNVLVPQVISMMGLRIKPIHIESQPPKGDGQILARGHALRIKQVLVNLFLNAADAIHELAPEGGGLILVSWGYSDGGVFINMTDNGIGLPEPGIRSEFAAFSTTKKLRGGQGLGLWLCSRLMENLGGKLTLSSEGVGKGVVARMTLGRMDQEKRSLDPIDLNEYFIDA